MNLLGFMFDNINNSAILLYTTYRACFLSLNTCFKFASWYTSVLVGILETKWTGWQDVLERNINMYHYVKLLYYATVLKIKKVKNK